jgi:transcriptional regulator PpsR
VKDFMLSTEKETLRNQFPFKLPKETIGDLDAATAARVMAASSDIAMIVDRDGIIRDISVTMSDLPGNGFADFVTRRWVDTVTSDSRAKVEEILQDATTLQQSRWREVNQQSPGGSVPVRFRGIDAGHDGRVILLGRDLRADQALQQRILQSQQTMERDYVRLRQAESRYRALFHIASEAVIIVEPGSRRIVEANPAAGALLGVDSATLIGQLFLKLFHTDSRDQVQTLLGNSVATAQTESIPVRLADGRSGFKAQASLFRQEGMVHALISLSSTQAEPPVSDYESQMKLLRVINRIPDAFVLTDGDMNILDVNLAFLELAQLPSSEAAKGEPLGRFLGRPGVDLRVLTRNLREHGWVSNFGSIVRTILGDQEDVELSAVSVQVGSDTAHGLVIRRSRRSQPTPAAQAGQLPRTAEELTQLVGTLSLREIVAETTDVIERMCIKAALNLTGNNRASAAEVLGLSRQSLYSKLSRHGLGSADLDIPQEH